MQKEKKMELARSEAKSLVDKLRASNTRAARRGGEPVPETRYKSLQSTLTKKLARL
jgi:hypothetical protein